MTAEIHKCISITCDACEYTYDKDEDGTVHYNDIPDVRAHIPDDWFVGDGGQALCGEDDEEHFAVAREWMGGMLTPDEMQLLFAAYPMLKPGAATPAQPGDSTRQEEA